MQRFNSLLPYSSRFLVVKTEVKVFAEIILTIESHEIFYFLFSIEATIRF